MLEMIIQFFKNLIDLFSQLVDVISDIVLYLFSAQL
ncbi:hypothetical protein IGI44_003448 [Enterococcus sp. DIV0756]